MVEMRVEGIRIAGVAAAVPSTVRETQTFAERFGGEAVEKFESMVGVKSTRVASVLQTSSDLAFVAAERLLSANGTAPEEIGCLVFVTQTPDYRIPSTACVLANRLGLSKSVIAFDVNLGCSGYVYGINVVSSLIQANGVKNALLLVGDTISKVVSPEDRSACMLFGDAGSATLFEKDEDAAPLEGLFCTDGGGFKTIILPAGAHRNVGASHERAMWAVDGNIRSDYELYMNGTDTFSFTITQVPKQIKEFMKRRGTAPGDYDGFVLHQANRFILSQVAKKAKLPEEKLPVSIDRYGNTSVSSIPLTICDAYAGASGRLRLLLCGFGIGLSWGTIGIEMDAGAVLPVIESDDYYKEGAVSHD